MVDSFTSISMIPQIRMDAVKLCSKHIGIYSMNHLNLKRNERITGIQRENNDYNYNALPLIEAYCLEVIEMRQS